MCETGCSWLRFTFPASFVVVFCLFLAWITTIKNWGDLEERKEENRGILLASSCLFSQITDWNGKRGAQSWFCSEKVICLLFFFLCTFFDFSKFFFFYITASLQQWKYRPPLLREVGLHTFKFPSIKERPGFALPFSVAQKQPALLGALWKKPSCPPDELFAVVFLTNGVLWAKDLLT